MQDEEKSLAARQGELERLMFERPDTYALNHVQEELERIIEKRLQLGELNEAGHEVPLHKRRPAGR